MNHGKSLGFSFKNQTQHETSIKSLTENLSIYVFIFIRIDWQKISLWRVKWFEIHLQSILIKIYYKVPLGDATANVSANARS